MLQTAEAFLAIRRYEWSVRVSGPALATLSRRKQSKTELLPCATDLLVLLKYQKVQILEMVQEMTNRPNGVAWHDLCTLTLSRVIIFKKRRS
jgi:hypothetical protein